MKTTKRRVRRFWVRGGLRLAAHLALGLAALACSGAHQPTAAMLFNAANVVLMLAWWI